MALTLESPHIHINDARGRPGNQEFLLPGESETDYLALFQILRDLVDKGFAAREINSQVHKGDKFEPIHAPVICYERKAAAFCGVVMSRPDC